MKSNSISLNLNCLPFEFQCNSNLIPTEFYSNSFEVQVVSIEFHGVQSNSNWIPVDLQMNYNGVSIPVEFRWIPMQNERTQIKFQSNQVTLLPLWNHLNSSWLQLHAKWIQFNSKSIPKIELNWIPTEFKWIPIEFQANFNGVQATFQLTAIGIEVEFIGLPIWRLE